MAKKVTIEGSNKLSQLSDDWGGKNQDNTPVTIYGVPVPAGAEWGMNRGEVERFVKEELKKSFGYSRMVGNMLQHFRSIEDAEAYDGGDTSKLLDQTDISGKTNVVFKLLQTPLGSSIYINGNQPYLFPIFIKSVEVDGDDVETPTSQMVTLTINVTRNGSTTATPIGLFEPNVLQHVNIRQYISGGASFTITATDDQGNRRTTQRYNVTLTSMNMETRNNTWWATAYKQGNSWSVPLRLEVNISCRLNATLKKDDTTYVTKTVLREDFLTNYDLTIEHPITAGGESGVYKLVLELVCTDESLSVPTQRLEYNVFCVAQDESRSFIVFNNMSQTVANYESSKLLDYAVFGNNSTLDFVASVAGSVFQQTSVNPETETVSSYYVDIEVERADTEDFTMDVVARFNSDEVLSEEFTVSNSAGYAATSGSMLFVRAFGRTNDEVNRTKLYNISDGQYVTPNLSSVSFSTADGWRRDIYIDKGGNETYVSYFRLLGGSTMEIPVKPLSMAPAQGRTFEILFQPRNSINENTPIITCAQDAGSSYIGLKVTSSNVTLLTTNSQDVDNQSIAYDSAEPVHLAIVVNPAYTEAGTPFDVCFIYINGVKQRAFAYSRDLNVNSNLIIGCPDAGIDWYGIRVYNNALTTEELQQNAANWKLSRYEKAAFKAKCDIRENNRVDFNKVRSICNVFVFRANDGSGAIPRFGMSKGQTIAGRLSTYWHETPEWNKNFDIEIEGQGTTSMEYWRWNFKGSFPEAVQFDGGSHTSIKKICAKKNFASSMQSHKMGGCEAFDYLARATGAVPQDAPRQAIWQYPFVGFSENEDGTKTFIGLYTIGPDKGDKDTFGFGSQSIAMEGLDNDVLSTNFRVPWNDSTVTPDSKNEKYDVCGESAWEDSMKNAQGVVNRWKPAYNLVYECSQLIRPWLGATIGAVTYPATAQGLIDYGQHLNDIDTSTAEGKAQYEDAISYEYWIATSASGEYNLYFYNPASHAYVQSYTTSDVNLQTQLCNHNYQVGENMEGSTPVPVYLTTELLASATDDSQRNELFKKARLSKFRAEAGNFWDITNALFHLGWCEFNAASDNLAKNTYPYLLNYADLLVKFRWRQDDVDTVWPIENQGKDKKPYCVELDDDYADYGMSPLAVFNGRKSQFWFTLIKAFQPEYETFMRTVFIPCLTGYNALDIMGSTMAFFHDFYFNRAQEYFGAALYNADSTYCYEQAHLAQSYTTHRNIALQQLLGDHYSAEKRWIRMRAIYMMSKYNAGMFAAGSTTDALATRVSSGQNSYTLTPAIYMYPSVDFGQTVHRGPRFWPGNPSLVAWTTPIFSSDGDQAVRFHGMSYLRDVGNLYQNTLKDAITIYAPMLRNLLLGNKDAEGAVASVGITSVLVDSASTMRKIDLSGLVNLGGIVNLSACTNLRELYIDNTAIQKIIISNSGMLGVVKAASSNLTEFAPCEGVTLTDVTLPSTLQTISLNRANVSSLSIGENNAVSYANIRNVSIRNITGAWSAQTFVTTWLAGMTDAQLEASSLTLSGINWIGMSASQVMLIGKVGTKNLNGRVSLVSMSPEEYDDIMELFGPSAFSPDSDFIIDAPPAVHLSGPSTLKSGETGTYSATVFPIDAANVIKYILFNGTQEVTPSTDSQGVFRKYGSIKLYEDTGVVVIDDNIQNSTIANVRINLNNAILQSPYVSVTAIPLTYPSALTISGSESLMATGNYEYTKLFDTDNYSAELLGVEWSLSDGSSISISSQSASGATLAYSAMPQQTTSVTLTCTATFERGVTVTGTKQVSLVVNPLQSFDIIGPTRVQDQGTYQYLIGNILPANYNVGISSLSASISTTTGVISVIPKVDMGGVTLEVTTMPSQSEEVTLTVVATIVGGSQVFSTKAIKFGELTGVDCVFQGDGSTPVTLIGSSFNISSISAMTIDGVPVAPTKNYTFNDTDFHNIHIDLTTEGANYLFANATRLKECAFGSNFSAISDSVFYGCTGLTSFLFPRGCTSIGYGAFQYCSSLTAVVLPETITSLGNFAFRGCKSLGSITIPRGIISIGDATFRFCNLNYIAVEAGNPVYDSRNDCNALVNTATGVLIIGSNNTIIPNSVTSIGFSAFSECTSLTSITIPNSVTSIGQSAFQGCTGLTSITIPNSVTSIGFYAFSDCSGLTSVTISEVVTTISNQAFQGCTSLTSITIPNSVTSIGFGAFQGCISLASITIPEAVTEISDSAFTSCRNLTSVTIGSGVTNIKAAVFMNCYKLSTITCNASTAPTVRFNTFDNIGMRVPSGTSKSLNVPAGATGYDTDYWKTAVIDKGYTLNATL